MTRPTDVPDDHDEQAEVEQRAADPQQPRLVELRGAGGPAELVVAVAPDRAADQDGEHDVGQHAPEQDVAPASSRWLQSGGSRRGVGSSPTCSRGGPLRPAPARRRRRRARRPAAARRPPRRARRTGVPASMQGEPQQLEARPVLLQQREPAGEVGGGGELEHRGQVVGQLAVRVDAAAARPGSAP